MADDKKDLDQIEQLDDILDDILQRNMTGGAGFGGSAETSPQSEGGDSWMLDEEIAVSFDEDDSYQEVTLPDEELDENAILELEQMEQSDIEDAEEKEQNETPQEKNKRHHNNHRYDRRQKNNNRYYNKESHTEQGKGKEAGKEG